jgi:hypothetical protein
MGLTLLIGQWWNIVLQAIQVAMQKSINILVSCDEVTTIDNQSWFSIHVDVIE